MLALLIYTDGPWEQVRGYLKADLEHIQAALNTFMQQSFDPTTNTILPDIIAGDRSVVPRYVANTGANGVPTWDQVDLSSTGVKSRLPYNHFPTMNAGTLLGRRSGSSGNPEEITPSTGLTLSNQALSLDQRILAARQFARM